MTMKTVIPLASCAMQSSSCAWPSSVNVSVVFLNKCTVVHIHTYTFSVPRLGHAFGLFTLYCYATLFFSVLIMQQISGRLRGIWCMICFGWILNQYDAHNSHRFRLINSGSTILKNINDMFIGSPTALHVFVWNQTCFTCSLDARLTTGQSNIGRELLLRSWL